MDYTVITEAATWTEAITEIGLVFGAVALVYAALRGGRAVLKAFGA